MNLDSMVIQKVARRGHLMFEADQPAYPCAAQVMRQEVGAVAPAVNQAFGGRGHQLAMVSE